MNLVLGLLLALGLAGAPQTGITKHYYPGVFAKVAQVRHMPLSRQVAGYAAVSNCVYVDPRHPWTVVARIDGGPLARYEVLDCQAPQDAARYRREGLILEVDYATAVRHPRLVQTGRAPAQVLGYARLQGD